MITELHQFEKVYVPDKCRLCYAYFDELS